MRYLYFLLLTGLYPLKLPAQGSLNLDFENIYPEDGHLYSWYTSLKRSPVFADTLVSYTGKSSAVLFFDTLDWGPVAFSQSFPALYKGATLHLSAYVKTEGVHEEGWASPFLVTYGGPGLASVRNLDKLGPHGNTDIARQR
jgi:hypothetical protein